MAKFGKNVLTILGNYFGGDIATTANALLNSVKWSDAIKAADNPTIYPVVNSETGVFSGNIRPYNEYYLVAYLANLTSSVGSKVRSELIIQLDFDDSEYLVTGEPVL